MQYKEQESSGSKKSADKLTSDRDLVDTELFANVEYLANLNDMCVVNVMPGEEELQRRVAEMTGLEEALSVLSESELMEVIDTFDLNRAVEALTVVTDAVALSSVDRQKLVVLVRSQAVERRW